jgi:hypothetical protein
MLLNKIREYIALEIQKVSQSETHHDWDEARREGKLSVLESIQSLLLNEIEIHIRKNYNADLGHEVWTIERKDNEMLFPAKGIKGLNYSTEEAANENLPKVIKSINNGGGQF